MNLTPKETSARLGVAVQTLANWRLFGTGPRFLKLGGKILYPLAEIEAFEQANLRESTSQRVG